MAPGKVPSFVVGPVRVASFSELDSSRSDWSILVRVVDSFWDIPPTKMHKQMTFNVILADSQGVIALAVCRRRDIIRRLYGVLIPGFTFLITRFSVLPGPNIINYDLKLMIEPYTKVEFLRDVIRAPDKIFKPLRSLATSAICEPTLLNVVGLVTSVSALTDVIVDQEILYRLDFDIVDSRGSPFHCCFTGSRAYWASVNYSWVAQGNDFVVALLCVKMKKMNDGEILFLSHFDMSQAIFNYNHPAVFDFRAELSRAYAAQFVHGTQSSTT